MVLVYLLILLCDYQRIDYLCFYAISVVALVAHRSKYIEYVSLFAPGAPRICRKIKNNQKILSATNSSVVAEDEN